VRRRFDARLWPVLQIRDPIKGLNEVAALTQLDKGRWEAPALAGIFHAEVKAFSESAKALEIAYRLAPPDRRSDLKLAVEAAGREATFDELLKNADSFFGKGQYEAAAKAYESAWKAIPDRFETGFQAAAGFLMQDQVASAVEVILQMRASATGEVATKISAMLHELAPISPDANTAAGQAIAVPPAEPRMDTAMLVRKLVGPLSNSEVELVVKSEPPYLSDTTTVTPIPDEEVTGGRSDMAFLTTESIFAMYKRDLATGAQNRPADLPAPAVPESLAVSLPVRFGYVVVESERPGLPVYVNGQKTGNVTPTRLRLAEGEYEVGVEVDGQINAGKVAVKDSAIMTIKW
jgi:tetratricopeptide (TPR) repeat protein